MTQIGRGVAEAEAGQKLASGYVPESGNPTVTPSQSFIEILQAESFTNRQTSTPKLSFTNLLVSSVTLKPEFVASIFTSLISNAISPPESI